MKYAAIIEYTPDTAKTAQARTAHREYLKGLQQSGNFVVGGPFAGDIGALIVYEAETPEQVEVFLREDPFYEQGVFISWIIRPWKIVMVTPGLLTPA
jgi:uncharacterized protein YciI